MISEFGEKCVAEIIWTDGEEFEVVLRRLSPLCIIGTTRECVGFAGGGARSELKRIFVMVDLFGSTGLSAGEDFGGLEILKGGVVGEDDKGLMDSFKVVSPDFDGCDDC